MKPEDLPTIYGLLPYTAMVLIEILGATPACALLAARPGCTLLIPKHPDHNPAGAKRWAELVGIVGEEGMQALATRYGGDVLDIPTCKAARDELRHRAIRAEFDRLTTSEGMSGKQAIYEIGLKFAPISSRAIEQICGKADAGQAVEQAELF
jgi:hypothetical protein